MEQRWQIPHDSLNRLVEPLKDLKAHGFDTLLQSLFSDLKVSGALFSPTSPVKPPQEGRQGGGRRSPPHCASDLWEAQLGRCSVAGDVMPPDAPLMSPDVLSG